MGCIQSNRRCIYMDEKKHPSVILDGRPNFENRPEITDEHKKIVKETWSIIKLDISRVGVVLFMR